jgi:uncharacterized protein (TIGR02145 family)
MSKMTSFLSDRSKRGAAMLEYGLLVGLVAVAAISTVAANGEKVSDIFGKAADEVALGDGAGADIPPEAPAPWACGDQIEIAGEDYGTVAIGQQCWTTENLRAPMENSMCYANDPANCEIYGRLYWNQTQNGITAICPADWRLPGDGDWNTLISELGGNPGETGSWKRAGGVHAKLADWTLNGTNSSGFSAKAGGLRNGSYGFQSFGDYASFLSAGSPRYLLLSRSSEGIYIRQSPYLTDYHMSARCMTVID